MKCRLMIGIAWMLWSLQTHADQNVTGSWHGVVDGHDVEVAFVMDGSGSQVGYLYAPADDCFSSVGVQIEKVLNDAGNFDIYDALFIDDVRPYQPGKSCDQAAGFSGFGRFTLSNNDTIAIDFTKLSLFSDAASAGIRKVTLSRVPDNVISNQLKKMFERGMRTLHIPESSLAVFRSSVDNRGVIERSDAYWANYKTESIRKIFDGDFTNAQIHQDFAHLYVSYQGHFYNACEVLVPKDSPSITTFRQTYEGDRLISTREVGTVYVRRAFWDKYSVYKQLIADVALRNTYEALYSWSVEDMWNVASGMTRDVINVRADLIRMFETEGCDSGFQRQFSENLRRLGYGEVVLQKDAGKVFPYAANDTTKDVAERPTIESVCYKYYTSAGGIPRDDERRDWCNCLGRGLQANLSQNEMTSAMNDFASVDHTFDAQPTGDDPRWRYINVRNGCMRH